MPNPALLRPYDPATGLRPIFDSIFKKAVDSSAVMTLAPKMNITGNGKTIAIINDEDDAVPVVEGMKKPELNPTVEPKYVVPYTFAKIFTMSKQYRRDYSAIYQELMKRAPGAIARGFDRAVFGAYSSPGTGFYQLSSASGVNLAQTEGVWDALVEADTAIAVADGMLDGWALSVQGRAIVLRAKDNNGMPIYVSPSLTGSLPSLYGLPAKIAKRAYIPGTPNTVGFGGDWSQSGYGIVGSSYNIDIAKEATINGVNLFENNLIGVRVEADLAFVMADPALFVKLLDGEPVDEPEDPEDPGEGETNG